jgi:hypothetical protein
LEIYNRPQKRAFSKNEIKTTFRKCLPATGLRDSQTAAEMKMERSVQTSDGQEQEH